MGTQVIGEVVYDGRHRILHFIIVSKQFIAGRHIWFQNLVTLIVISVHDVNEREQAGICTAFIRHITVSK